MIKLTHTINKEVLSTNNLIDNFADAKYRDHNLLTFGSYGLDNYTIINYKLYRVETELGDYYKIKIVNPTNEMVRNKNGEVEMWFNSRFAMDNQIINMNVQSAIDDLKRLICS